MLKSEIWVAGAVRRREKIKVIHVGDHMVQRSTQAIMKSRWSKFSETKFQEVNQPYEADKLARLYKVSDRVNFIYTVTEGIITISDIIRRISDIKKYDPDFVLIDIGANDFLKVTRGETDWKLKIQAMVEECKKNCDFNGKRGDCLFYGGGTQMCQ